jgi:predicted nuclease of predicted toxin-antitoxin system
MKFLVDAQLPRRMAGWLSEAGYDARHTLDLPAGNRTTNAEVMACAVRERRIVVTNVELECLARRNIERIEAAFAMHRFVELNRDNLVIHE